MIIWTKVVGEVIVDSMHDGRLVLYGRGFTRRYMGYTLDEAIERYLKEVHENREY